MTSVRTKAIQSPLVSIFSMLQETQKCLEWIGEVSVSAVSVDVKEECNKQFAYYIKSHAANKEGQIPQRLRRPIMKQVVKFFGLRKIYFCVCIQKRQQCAMKCLCLKQASI